MKISNKSIRLLKVVIVEIVAVALVIVSFLSNLQILLTILLVFPVVLFFYIELLLVSIRSLRWNNPDLEDFPTESRYWPTVALEESLRSYSVSDDIDWPLAPDVTYFQEGNGQKISEIWTKALLLYYMPDILIQGPELILERNRTDSRSTWGGILARALQKGDRACCQYIIIYTRQLGVVSLFWWVLFPLLMAWWITNAPPETQWAAPLMFLPFLIAGISDIVRDVVFFSYAKHHWRINDTSLVPFYYLMLVPIPFFPWFSSISAFILVLSAFICFIWWYADRFQQTPTGHPMDYIPIFVWLRRAKEEDKGNLFRGTLLGWEPYRITYDKFHYEAASMTQVNTEEILTISGEAGEKRALFPSLIMDNMWHSLREGSTDSWITPNRTKGIVFLIGILFPVWLVLYTWLSLRPTTPFMMIYVVLPFVIFTLTSIGVGGRVQVQGGGSFIRHQGWVLGGWPYDGEPPGGPERINIYLNITNMSILDHSKLKTLWNLHPSSEEEFNIENPARFLVVSKMQDPFAHEESFESFRDNDIDLYRKIRDLQRGKDSQEE